MIHLYFGPDIGLNNHQAKADLFRGLTEEEKSEIISYDGYKDPVVRVVDDADSFSLFAEKKRILFTGCYFLCSERSGKKEGPIPEDKQDYKALISYLNNPSADVDLYMVCPGKIDSTSEIVNTIKLNGKLHPLEILSEQEYIDLAIRRAADENKKIDKDAAKILFDRTKGDYLAFKNNLDKVLTYTSYAKKEDVKLLVTKPLEDDVFEIVKATIKGDVPKALASYQDLRKSGQDATMILYVLVSQFRFFALVSYFTPTRESNDEIARELSSAKKKVSPGRIYYVKKDVGSISFYTFLQILADLAELEQNQRRYQDDLDTSLTLFLTEFRRRYLSAR